MITVALPGNVLAATVGTAVTITATVSQHGTVNFEDNGVTIGTCGAVAASTSATCSWTPSTTGSNVLTATLTPTDPGYVRLQLAK